MGRFTVLSHSMQVCAGTCWYTGTRRQKFVPAEIDSVACNQKTSAKIEGTHEEKWSEKHTKTRTISNSLRSSVDVKRTLLHINKIIMFSYSCSNMCLGDGDGRAGSSTDRQFFILIHLRRKIDSPFTCWRPFPNLNSFIYLYAVAIAASSRRRSGPNNPNRTIAHAIHWIIHLCIRPCRRAYVSSSMSRTLRTGIIVSGTASLACRCCAVPHIDKLTKSNKQTNEQASERASERST